MVIKFLYLNARIKPNDESDSELVLFKYNYTNLTFCNYKTNYKNIKRKEYSDYKFNNVFDQNDNDTDSQDFAIVKLVCCVLASHESV